MEELRAKAQHQPAVHPPCISEAAAQKIVNTFLGNIAPLAFEKQFAAKQPIAVSEIT
ncbi:hypothetical protein [Candidatus Nitrotoga sp. AM1P]|uniref:hypothetical protein n=1 Tax=Candidatus Nitrotoga sp. AM1P TaxID=2559597 RepID=UPI0010BA014A|nr:hypothetical protein [Candidatus Nitrotoga sp. AM1P]BBJ22403.1 hypothetical protein W01_03300 [Candidatus Nitrotoga sp. AM1P]